MRPGSSPSLQAATLTNEKMETSESGAAPAPAPRPGPKQLQSPGSSPDTDQDSDFVLVPNSLAGDSSRNKNMHAGYADILHSVAPQTSYFEMKFFGVFLIFRYFVVCVSSTYILHSTKVKA